MADQEPQGEPSKPDYAGLKQSTSTQNPTVDEIMDAALPDDTTNPILKALKDIVRKSLSRRDEYGRPFLSCTREVMGSVEKAVVANPSLATPALIKSLTKTAMHDGELFKAADGHMYAKPDQDFLPVGRGDTVYTLGTIIDQRPDLANSDLVKNMVTIATNEPDSAVRAIAQNTLARIVNQRPDLADGETIKAVSQVAASSGAYRVETNAYNEKLVGQQSDKADEEARSNARWTLQKLRAARPDLFNVVKPAVQSRPGRIGW
jgi:hypothetical protein